MFRQPDFVIHTGRLKYNVCALVHASEEEAEGNRVGGNDVGLLPLQIGFVDPDSSARFGKTPPFFALWFVAGAGLCIEQPRIASLKKFRTNQAEGKGVGNFAYKFA